MKSTNNLKRHASITPQRLLSLVGSGESIGICTACGEEAHGVEPDAQDYRCEACGTFAMTGVESLLVEVV